MGYRSWGVRRAAVRPDCMRDTQLVAPILFTLCFMVACASVQTQYDYDPAVDFSGWRTYAWYPDASPQTGHPRLDNPLLRDRIEAAVSRGLGAKGFSPAGLARIGHGTAGAQSGSRAGDEAGQRGRG